MNPLRIWTIATRSLMDTSRKFSWWVLVLVAVLLAGIITAFGASLIPTQQQVTNNCATGLIYGNMLIATMLGIPMATILFGMRVARDHSAGVHRLLFATGLRPWEHLTGHALAATVLLCAMLAPAFLLGMLFTEFGPARLQVVEGPFNPLSYLGAALFGLWIPAFAAGAVTLYVAARTGKPGAVMFCWMPLLAISFFDDWNPEWLPSWIDSMLVILDPTGARWYSSSLTQVNRGGNYYSSASIGTVLLEGDGLLLWNRVLWLAIGMVAAVAALRAHSRAARPPEAMDAASASRALATPAAPALGAHHVPLLAPVAARRPSLVGATLEIARSDALEIAARPGLWAWSTLISVTALLAATVLLEGIVGETPLLTSGSFADITHDLYAFATLILTLPAVVGLLRRAEESKIDALLNQTRVPTAAIVLGRFLAGFTPTAALFVMAMPTVLVGALLQSGSGVSWDEVTPVPMIAMWSLLIVPTVAFWIASMMLCAALFRSHGAAMGAGILLLAWIVMPSFFGFDQPHWWQDWALLSGTRWSDLAPLELDRSGIVVNRAMVLLLSVTALAMCVRWWPRQRIDPAAAPPFGSRLLRSALHPMALVPLLLAGACAASLWYRGVSEAEGWSARDQLHEYHRSNLVTWLRAPQPTLTKVELDIQIDPAVGGFTAKTKLHLRNEHDHALQSFAITTSPYWEVSKLACTGIPRPVTMWPSDISGMLWTARTIGGAGAPALEPGETCVIDCEYECPTYRLLGREPSDPWIIMLEGGILLNSLELDFLPIVGFNEAIGAPLDLKPFRPEAGDGLAPTRPFFGSGRPIEVDAIVRIPEEYRANLPGVLESDSVAGGWRTMHWKTDKPVSELFHIVAGRWVETKGARSSIWHSPQHSRNVPSMVSALDGAREHYSRWFGEYPWRELRVSEFPGLLDYAQSGETNIVFSESMGFRALATRDVDAAFAVTAHEAAHQWWGGMLIPGEGPGGNILSEGLAQYSAARLIGVLRGERMRQSFMRQLEYSYIELRDPDSEDTLAEFDDGSPDAYTLLYHKGGWVFWMLANEFGYEASDRAHRAFIAENRDRRDHPLLADYLRTMGSYAVDDRRFEQFVEDWFESTRVGHYQIEALDSRQIPSRSGWWRTTVRVSNIGGVRMPIDVAFTNGEDRWSVHGDADFHEERMRVTIRPGDAFDLTVETPFEPREAIVDPDVCVLQVGRSAAVVSLADVRDDSYANYAPGFARSPSPAPVDGSDQGDGADEE